VDANRFKELKQIAIDVRRDCIKTQKLTGSGHLGGAFSALEMMVYLYFEKMNINVSEPVMTERDIFILSKGHASVGYYSVLARKGFFPLEELKTYRQINSRLQGHSHIDSAPGIECSTGSLGQGLSFGIGLALGFKKKGLKNTVYVMLGDGELEEGQIWEAFLLQEHLKLDNLIIIIDNNKLQLDDITENVIGLTNLKDKMLAFNFNVMDINGNDFEEIDRAFSNIKKGTANLIICNTIKGKGISFMENSVIWHAKKVDGQEYETSLKELDEQEVALHE
jgi:transketolase